MTHVRLSTVCAALASVFTAASAGAQQVDPLTGELQARYAEQQQQGDLIVKTVPVRHLSTLAAVKLLTPYVRSPGGGVFEVSGQSIHVITIREVQKIFNEMMIVLAQYDHDPASVTLNFQLIAAENTATRDPAVAGLDSLLRGVLKYTGYRLLNTSVATASEDGYMEQTLMADGEPMMLKVRVQEISSEGGAAAVHLQVELYRSFVKGSSPSRTPSLILQTGLTVPIGQTVVLGTSSAENNAQALILTVRPQLAGKR